MGWMMPVVLFAQPGWVQKPPLDSSFYIGIGAAKKDGRSSDYMQEAKEHALHDLASQITVVISNDVVRNIVEKDNTLKDEVVSQTQISVKAEVEDVEWVEMFTDGDQYWVYCRLSKATYREMMQKKRTQALQQSYARYTQAKKEEQGENIAHAIEAYLQVLSALGTFLNEPLKNSAVYKTNSPKPLAAMPLRFSFLRGAGELIDHVRTDDRGTAQTSIQKITATEKLQIVQASLVLLDPVRIDTTAHLFLALVKSLAVPDARFVLNVKGLEIAVADKELVFGASVSQRRIETAIKSYLSDKGFAFSSDQTEAAVNITIDVDAREGSEYQGLYVTYVDVAVSALDMRSGQEIFKQSLSSVKGISDSYQKSAYKASDEAAAKIVTELLPAFIDKIQK